MKNFACTLFFLISFICCAQINIKTLNNEGAPIEGVKITYNQQEFYTSKNGTVSIPVANEAMILSSEKENYLTFSKKINPSPKKQSLNILMQSSKKENEIKGIVFQGKAKKKFSDLSSVELSARDAQGLTSVTGGIEDLIKTLPYVNSNTELSSQYMVRGGNYDENLIYINDIEIYRPFLIRNSQQEGMSIINPDMVSNVNFSAGGFEARYGDKMSSVLNVYYKKPTKFVVEGEGSLIGGRLTVGGVSKNKKFSAIGSARYRNTNLILNTLKDDTDFNPVYKDIQTYLNYDFNKKWSLSFIGYLTQNDYEMIPKRKDINFGTLQQPINVIIGYSGKEEDRYRNMMGTASLNFKPNKKWTATLDAFGYTNREKEYYTISSGYLIQSVDPVTGFPLPSYGVGGQINHARNDLQVKVFGTQFKTKFSPDANTDYEIGVKFEREKLIDFTNEWQLVDSLGYSVPRKYYPIGELDPSQLKLRYHISGNNKLEANRISAYAQYSKKFMWGENKMFLNAGARIQHWDFTNQTLFSPRVQIAIKPDWESDMLFRLSGGVYYQAPFYKEIKDLSGNFNSNIKAQKSYQIIAANDYEFKMYDRPFKLTTELYYKYMTDLIPYYVDNVRVLYTGQNNAKGYSYGIDTRLFGEFVPGVDSWISASYARSYENIDDRGYIPRPTDQRFRLSVFFQDYMPKFPSMRISLTGVFAMGLPNGTPILQDPYSYRNTLPSYKRVDIGLTKVFIDQKDNKAKGGTFWSHFQELTLGVQIFNAFNIHNTVANQWIQDVNTNRAYAVPVYLTGRFFNVRLEFKL